MMLFRTDDPEKDFDRWDAEQEAALEKLPKCVKCKEPIQDDHYFDVNGELYCEEHMIEKFRKDIEDYVY